MQNLYKCMFGFDQTKFARMTHPDLITYSPHEGHKKQAYDPINAFMYCEMNIVLALLILLFFYDQYVFIAIVI